MKSRPKNKGKKFVPHQKKRKLSAVSPEVLFAQKLAANDPVQRNRAVKKLQKWLQLRGALLTKEEIMRIWKGLHYCFWMSDKPLVQEELAETIGHLIHCFSSENALAFIECGLITEGREWVGIDQWRMDKFMMLTRRYLRQVFNFLAKDKWDKVNQINEIFSTSVVSNSKATLGFRLHFTDIFLEEVAKAGGEDLEGEIILKLIEPFAKELAEGEDERLAKHIEERIYQHLMRQSDIGVASEEALDGNVEESEDDLEAEENEDEDMEEEELILENGAKDPRAGNVSVTLPQLKADFNQLADHLFQIGSAQGISSKRRTMLYSLNKQFKDLSQNVYPLIPDMSSENAKIPRLRIGKEAQKKSKEEIEYQEKIRIEREEFKKSLKRKQESPASEVAELNKKQKIESNEEASNEESEETEKDNSEDAFDTENVTENGLSPTSLPTTKKIKKKSKLKKKQTIETSNEPIEDREDIEKVDLANTISTENEIENGIASPQPVANKKKKKSKVKKTNDPLENGKIEQDEPLVTDKNEMVSEKPASDNEINKEKPKKKKKLKKIKDTATPSTEEKNEVTEPLVKIKKKKSKKTSPKPEQADPAQSTSITEVEKDLEAKKALKLKKKEKKKKLKKLLAETKANSEMNDSNSEETLTKIKVKKKKKVKNADTTNGVLEQTNLFGSSDNDWNPQDAVIKATPSPIGHNFFKKSKKSQSAELKKRSDHISLLDKKRRISFALSQNKCQSINDIDRSMQDSPDIPFGIEKRPIQGVLKTKSANSTPTGMPTSKAALRYNTEMNSRSKAAKRLGLNSSKLLFRF